MTEREAIRDLAHLVAWIAQRRGRRSAPTTRVRSSSGASGSRRSFPMSDDATIHRDSAPSKTNNDRRDN